jgi:hypothetical protein
MTKLGVVRRFVKRYLFSKTNKDVMTFLFFLVLSGIFWLFITLNQTYEKEFAIPITITNVPKNAVLTSDETDTVRMTIRDKGIMLAIYQFGDALKRVTVNFMTYSHSNGSGVITAQELQKAVYQKLGNGSKIISTKPEKLEFYYNYGAKKMVPVRWSGRVIPEEMYFISRVEYSPDSVTIYAAEDKLDSINTVYTEQLNYANFRDTLNVTCHLSRMKGVKMVPDRIKVSFFTDVLTEERIDGVPIQGINLPAGKEIRTFPSKVSVTFVAGVSVYRNLHPEDFTVVVDYNDLKNRPSEKCQIYLKEVPQGISRARLSITQVDYLLEEQTGE